MGHWGSHAISNDLATDWFASVMESVAEAVDDAFAEGTPETVRAACVLLEQLGETYIWPAERMEVQLQAGIALLWEIVASEWCDGFRDPDEVRASIVAQIDTLRKRRWGLLASAPGLMEQIDRATGGSR